MANEEQKAMSDKPAEQAYHARGAGLREALELIRRTPTMPFPDPGAHSWRAFAEAVHRAYVRIQQVAEAALREPGADTGTTGATPHTFEPVDAIELSRNAHNLAVMTKQTIGAKKNYYITLKQLEGIIREALP